MLILRRHVNEEIVIAGNIRVVVTRVAGQVAWLGIEAPIEVSIVRGESPARVDDVATRRKVADFTSKSATEK